jgi:hypothetical protein
MGLSLPKYQLVAGTQADGQLLVEGPAITLQGQKLRKVSFEQSTAIIQRVHL